MAIVNRVIWPTTFLAAILGLLSISAAADSGYMQKLRDITWDMGLMHEYPMTWVTTGTAVPILSKTKVVPAIPNVNGQLFLKQELTTPAWDVSYRLKLEQHSTLQNLKVPEMVDLFACWFLIGNPRIRPNSIANNMSFGFRETFNGVGVFVFKESQDYKIIAIENQGNEQITLAKLNKAYTAGINGCEIDASSLQKELVMHLTMEQGMLTVAYGSKMRQSSQKVCIEKLYMPNLSNRGFLGISARNSDRFVKGLEVSAVKVLNMDPNFYKHADDVSDEHIEQEQQRQEQAMYTDEMEAEDLLQQHELEQEDLEEFIANFPGVIREEDTTAEVLYKMNEHLAHIIGPLSNLVQSEESLRHYIDSHSKMPEIVKSFEGLPKAIEDEIRFVQTIDFQLVKIQESFDETVQKALDVQSSNLVEVPGGQPLGLPQQVHDLIKDIHSFLEDVQDNAMKLTKQEKTLATMKEIEKLGVRVASEKGSMTQRQIEDERLEKDSGIGWSKLVFEELEWRLEDARLELINVAKSNSQWRSIIQTVFILLATLSVGLVWIKLNNVSSKGML